ncbi:MAG: NAD-dependent protein deacylase [Clostridiales Family XIII bacterium]|jgi:NAD-dependent deacetylase|nr:NAD-dependent protein deacylase [Clostridiales Family XIII bacterium]
MSFAETLAGLLAKSHHTVFFGGAGGSAESGIPDFRSEAGLYAARQVYGYAPEDLLSRTFFLRAPEIFFRYYKENSIHREAAPNAAHRALAALEERGLLRAVVTQNIDGLHQAAGSRRVLGLHGSNWRPYCVDCGARCTLGEFLDPARCAADGVIPRCASCGGLLRPDVVLYEESLDAGVMRAATETIARAELLIVGGTSLAVYPAAGLLQYFGGGALALINKTPTPCDDRAQIVNRSALGTVLSETAALLP